MHSQNEEPVRLVSHVSVSFPGFDLQPLGVTPLRPVQRLQQARCANVHRLKGAELQSENLAKFLVIINLEGILKETFLSRSKTKKQKKTRQMLLLFLCVKGDLIIKEKIIKEKKTENNVMLRYQSLVLPC